MNSAPLPSGRVAAYQVETAPAGAYVRLRLEQSLVPGVLLARDVGYIDTPQLNTFVLISPSTLCMTFTDDEPDLAGGFRELPVTVELGSLLEWKAPVRIDATSVEASPTAHSCQSNAANL